MSTFGRSIIGVDPTVGTLAGGSAGSTFTMLAANNTAAARFTAKDARDIASVWVNFSAVTSPQPVTLRIETIDTSSGKPTGTLYDANATASFTPTVGWNQVTFASLPTTGLTAGTEYAIVLLATGVSTTLSLRYYAPAGGNNPTVLLTAADGSSRASLAQATNSCPVMSVVLEDGTEEALGMMPYVVTNTAVYGTRAYALKLVTPASFTISHVILESASITGAPDDLRCRIMDASGAVVSGTTITVSKNSMVSSRRVIYTLPSPVLLAAGTYRVVFDQPSHATTSANSYSAYSATARTSAFIPTGLQMSTTLDVTATPIVWVDSSVDQPLVGLRVSELAASESGGRRGFIGG